VRARQEEGIFGALAAGADALGFQLLVIGDRYVAGANSRLVTTEASSVVLCVRTWKVKKMEKGGVRRSE
jgi:hypothetical protein